MSEEMQKQLGKILELMIAGLEKAGEMASKELPGLLHDYLAYYVIDAAPIKSVLFLLFVVALVVFIKKPWLFVYGKAKEESIPELPVMVSVIVGVFICIAFFFSVGNIVESSKEIASIKVAPRAYLIEKLRNKR